MVSDAADEKQLLTALTFFLLQMLSGIVCVIAIFQLCVSSEL